ncbi:unnamed protein product, partial [Brenthis ino]
MKRFWTSCKIDMLFNIEVLHDEGEDLIVSFFKNLVINIIQKVPPAHWELSSDEAFPQEIYIPNAINPIKMGTSFSSANSRKWSKKEAPNPESSRILFLLYLIHRTWNVVVEHMDNKSTRWRESHPSSSGDVRHFDSVSLDTGSCYSACSCSYCRLRDCAHDCVR